MRVNNMKMKTLSIAALATLSFGVFAGGEVTYSTEGYCTLKKEGVSEAYLSAYSDKLGMKPLKKTCASFSNYVDTVQPREWDYRGGKLYPGSIIKLSPAQITVIKAAKAKKKNK